MSRPLPGRGARRTSRRTSRRTCRRTWLFDLDNTLHDASRAVFGRLDRSMTAYIERELGVSAEQADQLRRDYWRRYGATLLGLERHHGIRAAHFLHVTHELPGLEHELRAFLHDRAALRQLKGRKVVLTNAPAAYARRVLTALDLAGEFQTIVSIEGMRVFGRLRPKPDTRMLRIVLARLKVAPEHAVLVEDTLGHLRAARRLGLQTVWMQGFLRANQHGPEAGARLRRRPHYVRARIRGLRELCRWNPSVPSR